MLIRSQNKEFLINLNNSFVIEVVGIEGDFKVVCSDQCNDYSVGCYSTKEKALKALDMIQDAYVENETLKTISTGTLVAMITKDYETPYSVDSFGEMLKNHTKTMEKAAVFQMPADEEVIV